MPMHLHGIYFCTTVADLSSDYGYHLVAKPKIFTSWQFTGKVFNPILKDS